MQVNAPASRARRPQSDLPRRLDRIILTLPTATSIQEQAIMRSRAKGALSLIWPMMGQTGMGQTGQTSATARQPELVVDWDVASCTQLVYLYSEITQKFDGHIDRYLAMKGKPRPRVPGGAPEPSLRMACMDVGGGTTDLMVTTYFGQENRVLHPEQTFREGFRVAGDDLFQRVIASIILPELEDAITAAGGSHARDMLRQLFAGDIGGQDQQNVQRRRPFTLRVLHPLAQHLVTQCKTAGKFDAMQISVAAVLGLTAPPDGETGVGQTGASPAEMSPPRSVLNHLEEPARARAALVFRLADTVLSCDRAKVEAIARETFQKVVGNMAEARDHLGVDVILLTGRPSRLPVARAIMQEMLVVPPARLISMHAFRTGCWYPFRDPVSQRIGDPKSTVAVGGMLIALLDLAIPNFKVPSAAFKMRSTANYFGQMNSSGQIPADRVLFHGAELDKAGVMTAELRRFAPVYLGARQLPLDRWTTMPLYRLDFTNAAAQRYPLPLILTLEKADFEGDPGDTRPDATLRREAAREAVRIDEITDANGDGVRADQVQFRLHTLGSEDDYWIDTGLFKFQDAPMTQEPPR